MNRNLLYCFSLFMGMFFVTATVSAAEKPVSNPYFPQMLESVVYYVDDEKFDETIVIYNEQGYIIKEEGINLQYQSSYIWDRYIKEYDYDDAGNRTLEAFYLWSPYSNEWIGNYKVERAYNSNRDFTSVISFRWDYDAKDWVEYYKGEYQYNSNQNVSVIIGYDWNSSSGKWVEITKTEYTYDANQNMTYYRYYEKYATWIEILRNEYGYDADNNLTMKASYYHNGSALVGTEKYEYEYDVMGNLTIEILSNWNTGSKKWVQWGKAEYEYDIDNHPALIVYYYLNGNSWEVTDKTQYESTYDSDGRLLLEVLYRWYATNPVWEKYTKKEYAYDDSGKQTLYAYYLWNSTEEYWLGHAKNGYAFDNAGNQTLYIIYDWDSELRDWEIDNKEEYEYNEYGNVVKGSYSYSSGGTQYSYDFIYSYSNILGIPAIQSARACVYPNPAADYITLSLPATNRKAILYIYDTAGKQCLAQPVRDNEAVSVTNLRAGTYLYRIEAGNETYKGKFLKK